MRKAAFAVILITTSCTYVPPKSAVSEPAIQEVICLASAPEAMKMYDAMYASEFATNLSRAIQQKPGQITPSRIRYSCAAEHLVKNPPCPIENTCAVVLSYSEAPTPAEQQRHLSLIRSELERLKNRLH